MAKKPIVVSPQNVLKKPAWAIPLEEIASRRIQRLISDMKDTLADSPDGVGLAAPQVGEPLQLFLVSEEAEAIDEGIEYDPKTQKKKWKYRVFINPTTKKQSRKQNEMIEGCLSVPRTVGSVKRSEKISIEWHDEHGNKHNRGFSKFFARVIQHEMDHLRGVLITDVSKRIAKGRGAR